VKPACIILCAGKSFVKYIKLMVPAGVDFSSLSIDVGVLPVAPLNDGNSIFEIANVLISLLIKRNA